jgi:ligand-binding sensor domain-containing protein
MKARTITLVFIFPFLLINYCYAQNPEIKFNLVEPPNIGPLGNITAITQDPYGYMWFSGQQKNCLYKYDGVKMTAFRYDSLNTNSLGSTNLETVYADSKGIIWVGFFGGGMDSYNSVTGIFRHYRNDVNDTGSLSPGMVSVILRDHNGKIWISFSDTQPQHAIP